ncbi:hypothetical protein GCK32_016337 [Trichostrongylus colubriformis]|uniref:Uncharacterized protein n=1 Tax=Trichostrongylus colubriformis TaxID=6319 RepID=A0AAN8FQW2_TRICO
MGTPESLNASPTPRIRGGFPARTSSANSLSSDTSPHRVFSTVATTALEPATRFATADLIASVLHLDFWDDTDPSTIFFSKLAYEIISSDLQLPEKVTRTIKTHLEGEESIPDIAALISTIKADPLIQENGTITVLGSLLLAFVNSGSYDSRYRVLLRHLATLLGVVWEEFEDVEDSLAGTIIEEVFVETK